jgi:hypothetical protein
MSDAPQITPEQPLSVTLSIAQWRVVLEVLTNGPFRAVAPLIREIETSCTMQIQRLQPPMAMNMPPRGNGVAAEDRPDVG